MKININEVSRFGVEFEEAVDFTALDIQKAGITYDQPVLIKASAKLLDEIVKVNISATGFIILECGRCLEKVKKPVNVNVELIFDSQTSETVDVIEVVREEIIIEYPMSFLCKNDCQGLCAVCGMNLNENKCKCIKKQWTVKKINFNVEDN